VAAFPAYAVPLFDGFGQERESAVARTSFEDGMVKQLRTTSRVLLQRSITYGFRSKSDFQAFIAWFQNDIDHGAQWFDWTDPVDNEVKLARIARALEREEPATPTLDFWRVRMVIETWSS
jgi:hypothetical protein